MSGWETIGCANHPDRLALERCEVCAKPVCAYCLYYTADGQRLCAEHADEARLRGIAVEDPASYAGQLLGAQAGAVQKRKRDDESDGLYRGNSTDVLGLIALLIAIIALVSCGGGLYCLPPMGFILSLLAVINAKKAHDPARTRRYGLIGLLVSALWLLLIGACILLFIAPLRAERTPPVFPTFQPYIAPSPTPTPSPTPPPDSQGAQDIILSYPSPR
ncbi:MAG: hypothetical protein AAGU78_07405 [Chloroflexota bacterium]|nr:hypothetical protein [Anaerolineae bacterium]